MKNFKKQLILILLLFTSIFLSGCALINVNADRDNAQVIATVDGKDINKGYYNNYLAMVQMNYESSDQQWPTGHSLSTLKEDLYDSVIQTAVFAVKADKDGAKIDEKEANKTADDTIKQLKEDLGEDLYNSILEQNYSTPDQFNKWMKEYEINQEKATKTTDKFQEDWEKDPSKIADQTVGKINDTDVKRGQYEYYLLDETIKYYQENGQRMPTDEDTMEETNKNIFESIEKVNANVKYCEDNKIEVSEDSINQANSSLESQMSAYFSDEEQAKSLLENYYLTKKLYDGYQKDQAKGDAAENAIQQKCLDDVKPTDAEISTYYNTNKEKYNTTEVSAMHILTEDEDAANSIYDEAKDITTKEDFSKLVDKYKEVEGVEEATDLGGFDYGTMVKEFSDAAFNAPLNQTLKPVKTEYGYHVIYVYDKKEGEEKKLDDVKSDIEQTIKQEKGQEEYDKIEEQITGNAHYDIPDEIISPIEEYENTLKEEYKVTEDINKINV